jgi:hypothetical protein
VELINVVNEYQHNNKQRNIVIILIGLCLVTIMVCVTIFIINNNKNKKVAVSRTVMLYLVGSNLESDAGIATYDLEGIDYNKLKENNINFIL